jgi:hypothetical protein
MSGYGGLLLADQAWRDLEDHLKKVRRSVGRVSLTGLGFATAYFLDPEHGTERRRRTARIVRRAGDPPKANTLYSANGAVRSAGRVRDQGARAA